MTRSSRLASLRLDRWTLGVARPSFGLVALVLLILGSFALATPAAADRDDVFFKITDPRGDDHGDGSLTYPISPEFNEGELDLIELTAKAAKGGTEFQAIFAEPIRRPRRVAVDATGVSLSDVARFGFYTFNIDIYIDTDREPGSGAVQTLPGRRAELDAGHAWEKVVALTPRPHAARGQLQRLMIKSLERSMATTGEASTEVEISEVKTVVPDEVGRHVFFPTRVRVSGSKVRFFVPDSFLGGPAQDDWSYTVVVSGSDLLPSFELGAALGLGEAGEPNLMVLQREEGRNQLTFGGGTDNHNLETPIVDIIAPPEQRQERMLRSYNPRTGEPVRLSGVVPAQGDERPARYAAPTAPQQAPEVSSKSEREDDDAVGEVR
ncbi:MAG: glucodextranase DOMON-like domain-containing protein [Acidobacteriota bacterium]